MENASKALLMAAGVLIGILILSLTIYLFTSFASTSSEVHKENVKQQRDQFNSQFTSYEGKDDNTIYSIVTVANLATETNKYYEYNKRNSQTNGKDYYISVRFNGNFIERGLNNSATQITNDYNNLIADEIKKINNTSLDLPRYNCKVKISGETGRVYLVEFTPK